MMKNKPENTKKQLPMLGDFLDDSSYYYLSSLPDHLGLVISLILEYFFSEVKISRAQTSIIRSLPNVNTISIAWHNSRQSH